MTTEWWYELDGENRVVDVGPGWDEFALENDSPGATRDHVVGRPLADFIDGAQTRSLLETVLDRVRSSDAPVELPFRCDAPAVRRFMTLSGAPTENGGVRIRTRLLAEGQRDTVPLMERAGDRRRDRVRMCSWCNRIATGPDVWLEAETAAERLGLFLDREVPSVTHGICPRCLAGVNSGLPGNDGA